MASFATTQQLGRLAASTRTLRAAAEPLLHVTSIERHLPLVNTAAAYTALLHGRPAEAPARSVSDLPPGPVQDMFLRRMYGTIQTLAPDDRTSAVTSLGTVAYAGQHEALRDVVRTAQQGRRAMVNREAGLVLAGGAAHEAILRGERVSEVIDRHAIGMNEAIERLELLVIRRAVRELRSGHAPRVPELVAALGLSRPGAIRELQLAVARRVGMDLVQQDGDPDRIAARLGIDDRTVVQRLRVMAAMRNVELGFNVDAQVARWGIAEVSQVVRDIEDRSASTAGFRQVLLGRSADAAAHDLGIGPQVRDIVLRPLEARIAQGVAEGALSMSERHQLGMCMPGGIANHAIARGASIPDVAARFGITTLSAMDALEWTAGGRILATFTTGDRLCDRMAVVGLTNPARMRDIESAIAGAYGQGAVLAGDEPLEVARRLQLTRPESLRSLTTAAAVRDVTKGMSVPDAAARHGIDTGDEGQMRDLEYEAVNTHGRRLLHAGLAIDDVRERLGLQRRAAQEALRSIFQGPT